MADEEYPALGFDPLPGNPERVQALIEDSKSFGRRLLDQADAVERLAHPEGWTGVAAESFAAGLGPLSKDLRRFGNASIELSGVMARYLDRYLQAKKGTVELEERAKRAKNVHLEAQAAHEQAPRGVPGDPKALDKAWEDYSAIVQEARRYQEKFEESVEDIAQDLDRLAEAAPDTPVLDQLMQWAEDVFALTAVAVGVKGLKMVKSGSKGYVKRASKLGHHMRTHEDAVVRSKAAKALRRVSKKAKFAKTSTFKALGKGLLAVGVAANLPETLKESQGDVAEAAMRTGIDVLFSKAAPAAAGAIIGAASISVLPGVGAVAIGIAVGLGMSKLGDIFGDALFSSSAGKSLAKGVRKVGKGAAHLADKAFDAVSFWDRDNQKPPKKQGRHPSPQAGDKP